jgi:NitT/TauT family transport system substrate-binding protein
MRRSVVVMSLAASISLLLTACGSAGGSDTTSPSGKSSNAGGTTKLTVGTSPAILNASLYYASQSGIFPKNGLQVTPQIIASGQQAIPLLLNGQIQFAASDPVGVITAISHKIPVTFVAPAGFPSADPSHDFTGVLVKPSITTAADLNGKTIAVNAIGGILQLTAQVSIDLAGGDSSSIKFVAMSIPQMAEAVKGGQVDGAVVSEPYLAVGKEQGLKVLLSAASTAAPNVPTVVYVTSKSYASSHPDVVKKFAASLISANAELTKDPNQIRTVAVKSTGTSADILGKINLPDFKPEPLSVDALNQLQTLMIKYKLLPQQIDISNDVVKSGS